MNPLRLGYDRLAELTPEFEEMQINVLVPGDHLKPLPGWIQAVVSTSNESALISINVVREEWIQEILALLEIETEFAETCSKTHLETIIGRREKDLAMYVRLNAEMTETVGRERLDKLIKEEIVTLEGLKS